MREHKDIIRQTKRSSSHNPISGSYAENGYTISADAEKHFMHISDRMLVMLDFTREEIQSRFSDSFIRMVHPDDCKKVKDFFADNREISETRYFSCRITAENDRGYIWIKNAVQLSESDNKTVYHCQFMDITDEMEKQYSLEYLSCEHDVIMDSISAGMVVTDLYEPYTYLHKLKYCANPEGERISVIKAKPISIIYDREEISETEVGKIVDSNSSDISMCVCDDERVVVMTTPMADRLRRISRSQTHRHRASYRQYNNLRLSSGDRCHIVAASLEDLHLLHQK
jgi:hypothetical protein